MKKRFVAVTTLALTVLFSQGGGSSLAAICPHLRSLANTCHEMPGAVAGHNQSHHANVKVSAELRTEQAVGDAVETNDYAAPCNHCAVHSRNKRDDFLLQPPNLGQLSNDLTTPAPLTATASSAGQTVTWIARAHGPPGDNGRLYLLINVFRI
ncbi:MAG TPA: hypothetical protein VGW58_04485 [Pyrinomonadaceae bacterium]|nr:hypothetical protein [Pyrinomonadaceae bacterium]